MYQVIEITITGERHIIIPSVSLEKAHKEKAMLQRYSYTQSTFKVEKEDAQ